MTRETKLGIGVATSFLSLVAVVAYNSWYKTESTPPQPPEPPSAAAVAQVQPAAKPEQNSDKTIESAAFKGGRNTPASQEPPPYPALETAPAAISGGVNVPAPPGVDGIKNEPATSLNNPANTSTSPSVHSPHTKPSAFDIPPPGDLVVPPSVAQQAPSPVVQQPKVPGGLPEQSTPLPPAGEIIAKGPAAIDPKLDSGAASAIPGAPLPVNPVTQPSTNVIMPANPAPASSNQIPSPVNLDVAQGTPAPVPPNPAPLAGGFASQAANPNPLPPINPVSPPTVSGPGSTLEQKQVSQPAWPAAPVNSADPRTSPSPSPVTEIGSQTSITSPPIAIPTPPPAAAAAPNKTQVESFNERRYLCQPTDTDFTSVSKQNYKSDKYAQALMLYNRDHPIGKAAVQQGMQLQPGAEVYIPPVYVLESRYPNAIPNLTPLPQSGQRSPDASASPKALVPVIQGPPSGSPSAAGSQTAAPNPSPTPLNSAINISQPAPVQPVIPNTPTNVPPTAGGGQYKLYTVPASGQQFYEIARDTLGDGRRWTEIYQLNQQYDPQVVVPAGTQLKLPPEAYVRQ
jgi:hypothetical protein